MTFYKYSKSIAYRNFLRFWEIPWIFGGQFFNSLSYPPKPWFPTGPQACVWGRGGGVTKGGTDML